MTPTERVKARCNEFSVREAYLEDKVDLWKRRHGQCRTALMFCAAYAAVVSVLAVGVVLWSSGSMTTWQDWLSR